MAGVNPAKAIVLLATRYLTGLRFPVLLAITATLFFVDLVIPDFVPLVDEILLGLLTSILALWRTRRGKTEERVEGTDEIPDEA
ncbi:MAG: hypothetical protein KJO43_15545 [Phycisphaerae bacterium]|nr:hypothetical protein [Phycisphaerae bacterium]